MNLKIYSNNISDYLKCDDVIDYDNELIQNLSNSIFNKSTDEIDYIKNAYNYVRDEIHHSNDFNIDKVTYKASDVLINKHGICFAKSHLFAALLRCKNIPVGFCYQKLILDDDINPVLILHGLNGVYLKKYNKWIRLDARGNKEGVNASFNIDSEQLAFPVRENRGEVDYLTIYPNPDKNVINALKEFKTRKELWDNLPNELDYK